MPYITLSNINHTIFQTDIKSLDLNSEVYKRPIYFLNKLEKNKLRAVRELINDSENFLNEYYSPIEVNEDTYRYMYESSMPSYHKDIGCERLNSKYENFEIPEEIISKGKNEVIEFRKWFQNSKHLIEEGKSDAFVMRLQAKYKINTNPKNINRSNSGVISIENLTVEKIEERINKLIDDAGKAYHKYKEIIAKYGKCAYKWKNTELLNETAYSDAEVKRVLEGYQKHIKTPFNGLLIEYYRITLNPNLNFEEKILDQLGFRPCFKCYKKI